MRERAFEFALAALLLTVLFTESLSNFHLLVPATSKLLAILVLALGAWHCRHLRLPPTRDWAVAIPIGLTTLIWLTEGLIALSSPPNSSDAMAYHMPRVLMWIQQRSVDFFPTPYLNQIMLQPLHEYLTLHLYLLAGSDLLANTIAWLSTGGYILGSTLIARQLGASSRGQALTALLTATLPNGLLAATGAKNEALLAFLFTALVYYALAADKWRLAVACGLACFTKGTAYLFAGPVILLLLPRAIPHVALATILIQAPFLARNLDLSGSPLGFDSAHADGRFRWRNDHLSSAALASNLIRHTSEQLGSGSPAWNNAVFTTALATHHALGLDPQSPATTWPYEKFAAPRKANHETDANNRWHLLLFLAAATYLLTQRHPQATRLTLALLSGLLLFCLYLKWQPFMARMFLPLFATSCAISGLALSRTNKWLQLAIIIFLLDGARLPLLKSWIRPLLGPQSVLRVSRTDQYFADMTTWGMRDKYDATLATLKASPCRTIALDINRFQLIYPLQALLLQAHPDTRFLYVNVTNPSSKYEGRTAHLKPCALVCLACDRWLP